MARVRSALLLEVAEACRRRWNSKSRPRMAGRSRRHRCRAGEGRSCTPRRPPPGGGEEAGEVLRDPIACRAKGAGEAATN
jgi:hypothetical protein